MPNKSGVALIPTVPRELTGTTSAHLLSACRMAERPEDGEGLVAALERAQAEPGPHLIEAVIPSGF